jgi:hypothetical protein
MFPVVNYSQNKYKKIITDHVENLNPDLDPDVKIPGLPKWTYQFPKFEHQRHRGLALGNVFVDGAWKVSGHPRFRKMFFPPSLIEQVITDDEFPTIQTVWEENKKYLDQEFYRDQLSGILGERE